MKTVIATLLDNRNGKQVAYRTGYSDDYPDHAIEFHWTEGNYSCDHNRSKFIYGDDRDEDLPCNSEMIQLLSLTVDGRELLY